MRRGENFPGDKNEKKEREFFWMRAILTGEGEIVSECDDIIAISAWKGGFYNVQLSKREFVQFI